MRKKSCKLAGILLPAALTLIGAVGGWLYARYVGCAAGSCAITSNPWLTAGFGGISGLLLGLILWPDGGECRRSGGTE